MKNTYISGLTVILLLFLSCGGSRNKEKFIKPPVDVLVRDMPADRVFSVLLYDMNVEGNFVEKFYHQYKIVEETEPGKPEERTTEWMEVSRDYFRQHQDDMGMTLVSRGENGEVVKTVSPPGYNNYVGNDKYGSWQRQSNGSSFWVFYGQYAFMRSMFGYGGYPVRRSYYDDYRGNYYGRGRSYYGPTSSGRSYYGTNSDYNRTSRGTSSTWGQNKSNFKNKVNSRTQRSSTSTSRTSRSSSRYRGSSSRSRGGGYGK